MGGKMGKLKPSKEVSELTSLAAGKQIHNLDEYSDRQLAVEICEGNFTYENRSNIEHYALRGVNLKVPEGTIYGLLGPSGCGKTTLLSAVVGRLQLLDGDVRVFDEVPNSKNSIIPGRGVGYMPQELALYVELTIEETLTYFGRLHRLDRDVIEERMLFLLGFLSLPARTRTVNKLSGGQKRRVSLAVALIHKPPLLILDEPTVGVDPLLRRNIWSHLKELTTKEGMTVIITTHYIEEARQANIVGFMRKGMLLTQASPEQILAKFQSESLEECFLTLCEIEKISKKSEKSSRVTTPEAPYEDTLSVSISDLVSRKSSHRGSENIYEHPSSHHECSLQPRIDIWSYRRADTFMDACYKVIAIFCKNMTRFRRNLIFLAFQFLIPALQVFLTCLCIGRDPHGLKLGVLNLEDPIAFSAPYLEKINKNMITQVNFDNIKEVIQAVKNGDCLAAIVIPSSFSIYLLDRFEGQTEINDDILNKSSIKLYMDKSNLQNAVMMKKTLHEDFQEFARDFLISVQQSPKLADGLIVDEDPIYGGDDTDFAEFLAPGLIVCVTYLMAVGLTITSFVEESANGLMDRTWVSGISSVQIVSSHALTESVILASQVAGTIILVFPIFQFPSHGPVILVIVLTLMQGLAGMTMGLMIAAITTDGTIAMMAALGAFYPNILLSGIIWPIEGQPVWLQPISRVLPLTVPTESLRAIMSKGWSLDHLLVWSGFLITLGWITFFVTVAILVIKFKR